MEKINDTEFLNTGACTGNLTLLGVKDFFEDEVLKTTTWNWKFYRDYGYTFNIGGPNTDEGSLIVSDYEVVFDSDYIIRLVENYYHNNLSYDRREAVKTYDQKMKKIDVYNDAWRNFMISKFGKEYYLGLHEFLMGSYKGGMVFFQEELEDKVKIKKSSSYDSNDLKIMLRDIVLMLRKFPPTKKLILNKNLLTHPIVEFRYYENLGVEMLDITNRSSGLHLKTEKTGHDDPREYFYVKRGREFPIEKLQFPETILYAGLISDAMKTIKKQPKSKQKIKL